MDRAQGAAPQGKALTLRDLFESAAATHPLMLASRLEVRAAAQDTTAAERLRWPTLSVSAESDPGAGKTASVVSRALNIDQLIWDGGRNSARIREAGAQMQVALAKARQQQLDVFLQIVSAWQSLVGALERIRYSEEALVRLRGYQRQMQRRVDAQASPRIDLELSTARVLQTEVELTSAKTSLQVALTRLEQLSSMERLANRVNPRHVYLVPREVEQFDRQVADLDWQAVSAEHPAVERARLEKNIVKARLEAKQAEMWPQLYARVNQPLGKTSSNHVTDTSVFLGMRYTPGAGFASLAEAEAMAIRLNGQDYTVEAALRDTVQTLQNDREEFTTTRQRIEALERSVVGSEAVLESYLRQFQAGRKSWQDLLNAARDLVQNQYALADARATLVGAMHRIELRMGQSPHFP